MTERLILTPLATALEALQDAVGQPLDSYNRDATIHRFKYTFELSWKTIKRHLEWAGRSDTAALTRKELFREAASIGLIDGPER